jgi:hypothetical protein
MGLSWEYHSSQAFPTHLLLHLSFNTMSALLNGAEASVSAGHQQELEIDTSVHS